MSKPITPQEVIEASRLELPPEVISTFNDAIIEAWNGEVAIIEMFDVSQRIADALVIPIEHVAKRGYLKIENIYKQVGWDVKIIQPPPPCGYESFFEFKLREV